MNWIRNKIIEICTDLLHERYIEQDEKIIGLLDIVEDQKDDITNLQANLSVNLKALENAVNKNHKFVEKLTHINRFLNIGVDVAPTQHCKSWAVICVHNRTPHVQFFQFNAELKEIRDFIRWFENKDIIIDAHPTARQMLYHITWD